jgi:hypothetical protein
VGREVLPENGGQAFSGLGLGSIEDEIAEEQTCLPAREAAQRHIVVKGLPGTEKLDLQHNKLLTRLSSQKPAGLSIPILGD